MADTPLAPAEAAAAKGGLRYNAGKARADLLCPIALIGTSNVLEKGARKYAEWNWAKGMKWSIAIGCLLRHTLRFMAGFDYDMRENCPDCQKGTAGDPPENWVCINHTGLPEVDLIACNAMFLQRYFRKNQDMDDRFKG